MKGQKNALKTSHKNKHSGDGIKLVEHLILKLDRSSLQYMQNDQFFLSHPLKNNIV
jgi:hypothetical protein